MKLLLPLSIAATLVTAIFCLLPLQWDGGSPVSEDGSESGQFAVEESSSTTARAAREAVNDSKVEDVAEQTATLLAKRWEVSDPGSRSALLNELQRLAGLRAIETEKKAKDLGLPLVSEAGAALVGFDGELPLYDISHNADAAISTATDVLRLPPYDVDGKDRKIGLWDVSFGPNENHQELAGNIEIRDNAFPGGLHATHVAATMIGKGIDLGSTGMAPQAKIWSYSSADVLTELAAAASTGPGDFGKLHVSVHPYGTASGWEFDGTEWYGVFSDDGNKSNDYAPVFGQYSTATASWDGLVANFPYHLMVKSAGNHRDDKRPNTPADDGEAFEAYWSLNGIPTWFQFDRLSHPKNDKRQYNVDPRGFGIIDARASAKNILTVGSVSDAVTGGVRDLSAAILSDFSSAGPTDDGRIKPDVVANGESVYSADGWSTDRYFTADGTSMAAASAGGTALLLVDLQKDLSGKALQASTLKGLLIHTADDLGNPGPDYLHGWGLINAERAAELLVDHEAISGLDQGRLIEESLLSESDNDYFVINHDGASPLRITLCWTDQPGTGTSGHDNRTPRLVNDLNLCLVGPDATIYHPYVMPFTSTFVKEDLDAVAVTGVNSVDNVEQIYLNAPAGQYTIQINLAGTLTGTLQNYSLLMSGCTLPGPGVEVENPVPDQGYLVLDTNKIDNVADVDDVFSGLDHTYGISWTPAGILADAIIAGDGTIDLFPTATTFGTVEVTITAQDANGGFASDSFNVTLRPARMFVNMNSPAAPAQQDGATWSTAYSYLQDGLIRAVEGQEIWVAQGIYFPDVDLNGDTGDRSRTFAMVHKVPMYGGFAGGETTRGERNPEQYATILSGDIEQDDAQQPIATRVQPNFGDLNNSYRVVDMSACDNGDVLDGFVITAGRADFWPANTDGGGIYAVADVRIANCWITGNYASDSGGGLYLFDNNPIISTCRVNGNEASGLGGGVYARKGAADFYNCEFRGNRASDGGGLYLEDPNLDLLNCVISGNYGFFGGGGIHMVGGKLKVVNATLSGNQTFGSGGALRIVAAGEKPEFKNVIIWNNTGGGSTTSSVASVQYVDAGDAPKMFNSIVANSGGSAAWNGFGGIDQGGNLDLDPGFLLEVAPSSAPSENGDFHLTVGSPALDAGLQSFILADHADLDGDGDTGEDVDVDLEGYARILGSEVDLGPYEFVDLGLLDSDGDGLSDAFELTYFGDAVLLDPMSDLDGDGLTALAEFLHGEDPNAPLTQPVGAISSQGVGGQVYLTITYHIDPQALNFATYAVQRRGLLEAPEGWVEGETVQISSRVSPTNPDLIEIVERSIFPIGTERMEFMRIRHGAISNP